MYAMMVRTPLLDRLTTGLAAELHGTGVSVNALGTSGLVLTPGVAVVSPHAGERLGRTHDAMADAAVALCGTPPGRVTGRTVLQHGTARPAAPGRTLGLVAHVLIEPDERGMADEGRGRPGSVPGACPLLGDLPEVFSLDDAGHGTVTVDMVPVGLESEVAKAVSNCPERAIAIA
jgi:ferredoxin